MKRFFSFFFIIFFSFSAFYVKALSTESFFIKKLSDDNPFFLEKHHEKLIFFADCLLQKTFFSEKLLTIEYNLFQTEYKLFKKENSASSSTYSDNFHSKDMEYPIQSDELKYNFESDSNEVHLDSDSDSDDDDFYIPLYNIKPFIKFYLKKLKRINNEQFKTYLSETEKKVHQKITHNCEIDYLFWGRRVKNISTITQSVDSYFAGKSKICSIKNDKNDFYPPEDFLKFFHFVKKRSVIFVSSQELSEFYNFLTQFFSFMSQDKLSEDFFKNLQIQILIPFTDRKTVITLDKNDLYKKIQSLIASHFKEMTRISHAYIPFSLLNRRETLNCESLNNSIASFYKNLIFNTFKKSIELQYAPISNFEEIVEELVHRSKDLLENNASHRFLGIGNSPAWIIDSMREISALKHHGEGILNYQNIPFSKNNSLFDYYTGSLYGEMEHSHESITTFSLQTRPVINFHYLPKKSYTFPPEYKKFLKSIKMDPDSIIDAYKKNKQKTIILNFMETGSSTSNFLYTLFIWAQEEGKARELEKCFVLYLFSYYSHVPQILQLSIAPSFYFELRQLYSLPVYPISLSLKLTNFLTNKLVYSDYQLMSEYKFYFGKETTDEMATVKHKTTDPTDYSKVITRSKRILNNCIKENLSLSQFS